MRSKNAKAHTKAEREHLARVKALPCSLCGAAGPSDAHHIEQGLHFCVVALCKECHQGPKLGWHGERVTWRLKKWTECNALNETLRNLHAKEA